MSRAFDRYMVAHGAGHHLKFRDFNATEKCAHFLGVLSIASQAPIRGAFCIGERAATAEDVAWEAGVPVAAARKALTKLREVGVLRMDDDLNREVVHDWDEVNPPPRRKPSDEAERTRQRKRAERERQRDKDDVTPPVTPRVTPLSRDVTPPEVEGEVETSSLRSDGVREDDDEWPDRLPAPLHLVATVVHERLVELAAFKRVDAPSKRRVGEVVADFPEHDHRSVVGEVVDYWRDGAGARTKRKDLARVYRDRCARVVARPAGRGAERETAAGFIAKQERSAGVRSPEAAKFLKSANGGRP